MVAFGLCIFAFTTILSWSFYSEKCVEYLFREDTIRTFRLLWIIALAIGTTADLGIICLVADTLNAPMVKMVYLYNIIPLCFLLLST